MHQPTPPQTQIHQPTIPKIRRPIMGPQCRALADDERLVIALIRQIVVNGIEAPLAQRAMTRRSAAAGQSAFARLGGWLSLIANAATRQIAIGSPVRCCPSPDEVAMLAILAGAPRGDFALVHKLLGEFVNGDAVDALAHGAEQLGVQLIAAGIALRPVRGTGTGGS